MGRAASEVFISLPRFSNKRWFYHKNFRYHYLRLYGARWFMNNTLEVFYLNRGSEIEHRIRETIRQCVLYYRLHYDDIHRFKGVRPDFFIY